MRAAVWSRCGLEIALQIAHQETSLRQQCGDLDHVRERRVRLVDVVVQIPERGIRTMSVKVDGETVKGYKAEQFADAYSRVVGVTGVTRGYFQVQ